MMRKMLKVYHHFYEFIAKTLLLNITCQDLLGFQFKKRNMLLLLFQKLPVVLPDNNLSKCNREEKEIISVFQQNATFTG